MAKYILKWTGLCLCAIFLAVLCACGGAGGQNSQAVPPPPPFSEPEYNPNSQSPSAVSQAQPQPESVPASAPSTPAISSEPQPEPQPPPVFADGGLTVSLSGKTATVTFKTNVESTVNTILTTSGTGVGTNQFYDYFNRSAALDGAVSKNQVYAVTDTGKSISYTLPDAGKAYYLLVNAVENETGTWQGSVSVLKLYDPGTVAPQFSAAIVRQADSGDNMVLTVKTSVPAAVYAILVESGASAPTAQQVKTGGSTYGSTVIKSSGAGVTAGDKEPYEGNITVPKAGLPAGSYTAWFVLQNSASAEAPLGEPGRMDITV